MAYRFEKDTGDIVISGWENGIAMSPHKGIGNLQNVNISTETQEVMCNFERTRQTQLATTGTLTFTDSSHLASNVLLRQGNWVTVSSSTHTGELPNATYYVLSSASGIQLAATYNGSIITGFTTGLTATFVMFRTMGLPVASATETYNTASAVAYRYYILDVNSLVWCYDSALATSLFTWFLPDYDNTSLTANGAIPSGLCVLNGWLMAFSGNTIWAKPTVNLGDITTNSTTWNSFASGLMLSLITSTNPHFAFVGHQGKCYYTDGNFIGSIFPNTSLLTGVANVQSYARYTTSTTTGTIVTLIGGSVPTLGGGSTVRIPATFFPQSGFANPSALTAGTIYYIQYALGSGGTLGSFQVYAAASGGSALDITSGASGTNFYFNTYNPISSGGEATITFTPQRLNLPFFETAQSIAELGDQVIIGCLGNVLYPWNQISPLPQDLIPLPENNAAKLLTVNNMVYVFAGQKGNIYITNGSSASAVISIPDYCAGIAGTESSYIEPYFTWGGVMFVRGRVWFSIQDQTASKAGNCGGVWSFIPTQNFFFGQDTGLSLRLENKSSYNTYSGLSTVLVPSLNQQANGVQYWNAWNSNINSPTYGIDGSDTTPGTAAVIETDLIPIGTFLGKKTLSRIEYKLSAPLDGSSDAVSIAQRGDLTSSFIPLTGLNTETQTLSGYYTPSFEKGQWLQLQITLTPTAAANSSFVRLFEVRIGTK